MTSHIFDFDDILCDTEIEALTLENSLIKLYHPRYNIKLKDDKSYPYLKATVGEEYPRFLMTRRRDADKAKYFGPYTSTATVYGIISAMQKTFGLPSCRHMFPRDRGRVSSCVYKQLGCVAPCDPNVSPEAYREAFSEAVAFLSGNYQEIVAALTEKMNFAAGKSRLRSCRRLSRQNPSGKKVGGKAEGGGKSGHGARYRRMACSRSRIRDLRILYPRGESSSIPSFFTSPAERSSTARRSPRSSTSFTQGVRTSPRKSTFPTPLLTRTWKPLPHGSDKRPEAASCFAPPRAGRRAVSATWQGKMRTARGGVRAFAGKGRKSPCASCRALRP